MIASEGQVLDVDGTETPLHAAQEAEPRSALKRQTHSTLFNQFTVPDYMIQQSPQRVARQKNISQSRNSVANPNTKDGTTPN